MDLDHGNGGFPEPPAGEPVRVVRSSHLTCGTETRIRLPRQLPAEAVRRVVCDGCGHAYASQEVEEIEAARGGGSPDRRPGRAWRIASVPIAAAAVLGALLLIRGLEDDGTAERTADGSPAPTGEAQVVREPTYTLALPAGWERTDNPQGASFAASSADGTGEATLFITRDPRLDFAAFEARSLNQLRELAGGAEVTDRVPGPTPEETVVRLESGRSAPADGPEYEVTLRASDPYRYYLSTTLAPDASDVAREGASVIHGSFLPEPQ
jgi:hypothetical protein